MADVRLCFGKVFIFRDQNKCDHMLLFKDVLQQSQLNNKPDSHFPLNIHFPYIKKRQCMFCEVRLASYLTRRDKVTPYNLNYYCKDCFTDLHLT